MYDGKKIYLKSINDINKYQKFLREYEPVDIEIDLESLSSEFQRIKKKNGLYYKKIKIKRQLNFEPERLISTYNDFLEHNEFINSLLKRQASEKDEKVYIMLNRLWDAICKTRQWLKIENLDRPSLTLRELIQEQTGGINERKLSKKV